MLGVGQTLPDFKITGVKPGFNSHEENGVSAFETVTKDSFEGKWKVSQNQPAANRASVVSGLIGQGGDAAVAMAGLVQQR